MILVNWLLSTAGVVGILGIFIFIPIGIVLLVKASSISEQEVEKKKSLKKKGAVFISLPFILIIGSLILLTILNALTGVLTY